MARILVVDDMEAMRTAIRNVLESLGHTIEEAENGKVARDLIGLSEYDLVISDIQMPHLNGIELLSWIKANYSLPVILITGFSHLLETQDAFELGADDFITKPFRQNDLVSAIDKILSPSQKDSPDVSERSDDHKFCKIPIEEFVSSSSIHVSIFIRLSDKKYVRVSHSGDTIPVERVENYKHKGLHYLYARKEDFAQIVGFNLTVAKAVISSSTLSAEKKAAFMRYTTETVLEQVVVEGIDKAAFKNAKDCVQTYLTLISESDTVTSMMDTLNNHADWIYAHSLGVSVYSVMIAKKMGWEAQSTQFKLSLAGLFHDIGVKEIERSILEKPRVLLSHTERALYETHPVRSKDILQELREMPGDVVQIVFDHHEDCIGGGFPRQVNKHVIHPLAQVISVADQFCYHALKSPLSTGASASDAILRMSVDADRFDRKAFGSLKALCV